MQAAAFQVLATPLRVGEQRISAVDDHVALFEKRRELSDDRVHRSAGLDHDHGFARTLQGRHEFFDRPHRLDVFPFCFPGGEFLCDLPRPIERGHAKSLRFHVQDEVFTHDREANQSDIALIRAHFCISLITPADRRRAPTLSGSNTAWQFPFAKSPSQRNRSICLLVTSRRTQALWSCFGGLFAGRKMGAKSKASTTRRTGPWPNTR